MHTLQRLNRTVLAMTCAALALTLAPGPAKADDPPPIHLTRFTANAGVTVVFAPTSDPAVLKATVTGVVQSSSLGTCVDSAELEARFPTTSDQPVVVNGTATWTSINGTDSLKLTVSGTATPDPANPAFYNAKYQISFTGGTGAYTSARGLGEIDEVVMFTSQTSATTAWTCRGFVAAPR